MDNDQEAKRLRLEIAMDGIKAPLDGCWQEPKVDTILVRQLPALSPQSKCGAVVVHRYVRALGSADDLIARIKATMTQSSWPDVEVAEILGDGAQWLWNAADTHFPDVRLLVSQRAFLRGRSLALSQLGRASQGLG